MARTRSTAAKEGQGGRAEPEREDTGMVLPAVPSSEDRAADPQVGRRVPGCRLGDGQEQERAVWPAGRRGWHEGAGPAGAAAALGPAQPPPDARCGPTAPLCAPRPSSHHAARASNLLPLPYI